MNDSQPAHRPITLLIADHHDLFRTGLVSLLTQADGVEVLGQVSSGAAAVRLAAELRPDVILMDQGLPDLSGPDATRRILATQPDARVLALTAAAAAEDVRAALQSGACGFLAKDTPVDDLIAAVKAAGDGGSWLSPRAAEAVIRQLREQGASAAVDVTLAEQLSPRELDVLKLIAQGLENIEIAQILHISPKTVKNHVSKILEKLGLSNRIQAAIYAVRGGFG